MTPEDLYGLSLLVFGGYAVLSLFVFIALDQWSRHRAEKRWRRQA